ncbi:MAG: 3'-5' exonuclease [Erysipelotrichales bacterium]|nr:3'-5' exonuclease [Erysipelotrichales bacterium]
MFSKYKRLLVVDFETTGLDYRKDKIIEVGALCLNYKEDLKRFIPETEYGELISISFPLPEIIINLTGITDQMLEEKGQPEEEMYQFFKETLTEDTLMIAYNLQFDLSFLITLMTKYDKDFVFACDILDIMAVYKDRYIYPHKLESAIQTFSIGIPNSHRALDDVKATLEVMRSLAKEKNNLEHYVNKIGYNKKYGVSGLRLPHVKYIAQAGNYREIEKLA